MLALHERREIERSGRIITIESQPPVSRLGTLVVESFAVLKTAFELYDFRNTAIRLHPRS